MSSSECDVALRSRTVQPRQTHVEAMEAMFHLSDEQLHVIVHGIHQEMKAGLTKERTSTSDANQLKMIPSYVTGYPTGYEKGTYLALEISGVDIYVCEVKLNGEGGKLSINQYQYQIPDDLASGDDIAVLIDYVADCVADFQRRVMANQRKTYSMAISIGFAVEQTSLDRGTILALEHGFEFPNAMGRDVVDLFRERFRHKGLAITIVGIANDGVCTLLSHAYQHPSTRIGIVHSAGTNCAYYDRVANMVNFRSHSSSGLASADQEHMIINTEWCNFGQPHLQPNIFDMQVDAESNNRGVHLFEKMTTGMYLGEIVRHVLVDLVEHKHVSFTTTDENCFLLVPYHFDTSYMYVCEKDDDLDRLEDTRVVLEDMCRVGKTTLDDRRIVKKVCAMVGSRAAQLLGASIAGVVKYMLEDSSEVADKEDGFTIAISGDVYKDYPHFHPHVCETLKALIPDKATKLSVGIVNHSRVVGAAIVAMMAEKMDMRAS